MYYNLKEGAYIALHFYNNLHLTISSNFSDINSHNMLKRQRGERKFHLILQRGE